MSITLKSSGPQTVQLQTGNEALDVAAESPPKAGPPGPVPWLPPTPWDINAAYVVGPPASFVVWQGSAYVALVDSTGLQPDLHPEAWQLIVQGGVAGGAGPSFEQTFQAADTWTANHNLGYPPAVTCYDTDGGQIVGRITSNDATTTVVQFGFPVAGRITCS